MIKQKINDREIAHNRHASQAKMPLCGGPIGIRLLVCLLLLISVSSCAVRQTGVSHIWQRYYQKQETVMVAAHRGGEHPSIPENSLASIDKAIAAGADIVELDVRQTKDSVLVLMHDQTLDRTTTGTGEVKDKTYEELQQLRLTHHGEPTDYRILTMKEALLRAKGKILVDIDFKADGMPARFSAYREIADLDMTDHIIFFLYDYTEMEALHAFDPRIKLMPRAYGAEQLEAIINSGLTDIVHIDASYYSDSLIQNANRRNAIRIWANALGTPDEDEIAGKQGYAELFRKMPHINVVQTDYPERMVQFLTR